jgi:hypothetical protein
MNGRIGGSPQRGGRPVPCVSAQAQRLFREGYEHRPVDRHDLDLLEELDRGRSP